MCHGKRLLRFLLLVCLLVLPVVGSIAQEPQAQSLSELRQKLIHNSLSIETYLASQQEAIEQLQAAHNDWKESYNDVLRRAESLSRRLEASQNTASRLRNQAQTQADTIASQEKQIAKISDSLERERKAQANERRKAFFQGGAIGVAVTTVVFIVLEFVF